ncbi:MAG: LPS assembly protein LptD [Desulfobacteraceae bacterium]|nr:LPS assembly protein LptD [Desulfobacteraceae bacterium]
MKISRPFGLLALCLWTLLAASPARAEEGLPAPWKITADRLTRYQHPEIIVAEGNVILTREEAGAEPMVIKAAWMRYDVDLGQVKARGDVSLKSKDYLVDATEVELLLDKQTGTLLDSTVTMPQEEKSFFLENYNLYLSGREIEKTGELTYHIENGIITSCPRQPDRSPPWEIASRDVRIKKEGMAVLRDATLKIKDIPVAYTPYLTFPAITERKTGFLLPEISQSDRSGFGLITPYFVNLSPSYDITLYPGYLEKRGEQLGFEGRYMASEQSLGTFILSYLRDKTFDTPGDDYLSDGFLRTNHDRYWLRGKANQTFSDSLVTMLDLDVVSDQDYLREFRNGLLGYDASERQFLETFNRDLEAATVPLRTSSLQTVKAFDTSLLMGEVRSVQDVRDIPLSTTQEQTLPRVQFNGRSLIPYSPLSVEWETEAVNYWRKRGIGYQRLDAHPQLVLSMPRGVIESHLTGGVRETSYLVQTYGDAPWTNERTQNRTLEDFEAEVATTFFRDFGMERLGSGRTLTHTIRPVVTYNYIPSVDQSSLPYIDGVDRIQAQNWLTYGFDNFFNLGGEKSQAGEGGESPFKDYLGNGSLSGGYLGYVKLSQTYDIGEARRTVVLDSEGEPRPLSDVLLQTDVSPLPYLRLNYESAFSVYGQGIPHYKVLLSYGGMSDYNDNVYKGYKNEFFTEFDYNRDPAATAPYFFINHETQSQQNLTFGLLSQLTDTLTLESDVSKVWGNASAIEDLDESVRFIYHPTCWAVQFVASKTEEDRWFGIIFSLTGIGNLPGLGLIKESSPPNAMQ